MLLLGTKFCVKNQQQRITKCFPQSLLTWEHTFWMQCFAWRKMNLIARMSDTNVIDGTKNLQTAKNTSLHKWYIHIKTWSQFLADKKWLLPFLTGNLFQWSAKVTIRSPKGLSGKASGLQKRDLLHTRYPARRSFNNAKDAHQQKSSIKSQYHKTAKDTAPTQLSLLFPAKHWQYKLRQQFRKCFTVELTALVLHFLLPFLVIIALPDFTVN